MLNFNSIMIGTQNPKELIDFYKKVLDKSPDMEDEGWAGWQVGSCFINIGEHSEVQGKNSDADRIILNFETEEIESEYERIKATGAEVVKELYEMEDMAGMKIATFADPDGNYFQLMTPWKG